MIQLPIPSPLLQTALLTDEDKHQLILIKYIEWMDAREKDLTDTEWGRATEHLKHLGLVNIQPLPLGKWHIISQKTKNETWVKCCLTALGSFIFETYRPFIFNYSIPRPGEDLDWIDKQLASLCQAQNDTSALLARQETQRKSALDWLHQRYPRKEKLIRHR